MWQMVLEGSGSHCVDLEFRDIFGTVGRLDLGFITLVWADVFAGWSLCATREAFCFCQQWRLGSAFFVEDE